MTVIDLTAVSGRLTVHLSAESFGQTRTEKSTVAISISRNVTVARWRSIGYMNMPTAPARDSPGSA